MPFPWKKVKSARISQLVNDHLQNSQKRRDGSSLVVETGFPTSLIDLFIKNREKLKNPSKKKRRNPPNTPISDDDDPFIAGSPISFPSPLPPPPSIAGSLTPAHSPFRCPSPLHNLSVLPQPSICASEISVVGSSGGGTCVGVDEKEGDDERGPDVYKVLLGVLKVFLVVLLALGTKRLAVGITLSAFLLLFLEYVGKHASGFLKPCSEMLRSLARSVSRLLRFKEFKLDENNSGGLQSSASRCLDQEIQVVESKSYPTTHVEEIQPVNEIMDESSPEKRLRFQETEVMEKEELVAESKTKSRRAKIKSKMKKYVAKKFRCSRKENLQRPEEQPCNNDGESENGSVSSSSSGGRYRDEDGTREVCACDQLSAVLEEAMEDKCHKTEAGLTWRHLVLCLIVLIGLIGGRAFALAFTIACFLLLKLAEKLPRYFKIPYY